MLVTCSGRVSNSYSTSRSSATIIARQDSLETRLQADPFSNAFLISLKKLESISNKLIRDMFLTRLIALADLHDYFAHDAP